EDVAAAEVRQLLRDDARVDEALHLDPERLVDHRQKDIPGGHRDADDQQLGPLGAPEMAEQGAIHPGPPTDATVTGASARDSSSGSESSYSSRNASSRWAGSIVRSVIRCPAIAARNGPTSPSSWQVSRPSAVRPIPLTPGTPSSTGKSPSEARSSTLRLRC